MKAKELYVRCGKLLAAAAIVWSLASGCSAPAPEAAANTEAAVSVTDFAGRKLVFQEVPQRIVALSTGDLDIVYALGGTLVGRPVQTGTLHVKEAADVPQIGSTHTVDLEKIAYLKPDIVLGNDPMNTKDIESIQSLGSELLLTHANSISDIQRQIELLGQLLKKEEKAAEWVRTIEDKLTDYEPIEGQGKRVLLVYGAPGTYMAALPHSLSGDMLDKVGGINIASGFSSLQNYPQYAQLNPERVVEADPEVILIMTHGDSEQVQSGFVREMESSSAWNSTKAVQDKRIHVLPSELFGSNPGTRVVESLDMLHKLLAL